MAISSIKDALTQYDENVLWHKSTDSAELALAALRYLQAHRAEAQGHGGSNMTFAKVDAEIVKIEGFLGISNSVKRGGQKSRFVGARAARQY